MLSIQEALIGNKTLVFGHRGASAYAPMNTLPAFQLALEQGAHGIELDVRQTRDGHLVILHDQTVDHTTDGQGDISSLTLAEVQALDAGAWKSVQFAGTRIPTLEQVFEAVGGKLLINVEIKAETLDETDVEARVAALIARFGLQDSIIVSSFNPLTLRRYYAADPVTPIGFLTAADFPIPDELVADLPLAARHPQDVQVTPEYMAWAKSQRLAINVWTVNDPIRAKALGDLGVNAIITDQPDTILAALHS